MWQFGIPLFALTLSKAARLLVESHVAAAERRAIATPMRREEFELAKTLCTGDGEVHLADFVVLNLLRQGKLKISTIGLLRAQFDLLDTDRSGVLTLSEALAQPPEPLPPGEQPTCQGSTVEGRRGQPLLVYGGARDVRPCSNSLFGTKYHNGHGYERTLDTQPIHATPNQSRLVYMYCTVL